MVLGRVDDHHGVAHGPGDVVLGGALQGHVGDEVGHHAHLLLGHGLGHDLHTRALGVLGLGVEALQPLQGTGGLDLHPVA